MPEGNRGIAVIGMGCWYPGASDMRTLWENILARRREFRRMPDVRLPLNEYHHPDPSTPDMTYGTRAGVIDGFRFDWEAHRIPKTTYDSSDIVHWLALDVANKCLEDAGFKKGAIPTERTSCIVGNSMTGDQTRSTSMRMRWPFVRRALRAAARAKGLEKGMIETLVGTMETYYKSVFAPFTDDSLAGALSNTIAGRICNYFDLKGGGYTVDGACSSSLIAVATAANGLDRGEVDLALAGGVDISIDTFELIGFAKVGALTSKDMTVYDRRASGFIPGEGCGFVMLKRLADARRDGNHVYAVINGWGISSDGKGGITAPNRDGQALALRRTYHRAGYGLQDLSFIEGHGTGTRVGDAVELEAISLALGGEPPKPGTLRQLGITSFKSIVGHTKAAAGIGGFLKATLAVNQRVIPPTAGCKDPNTVFDAAAKKLYPVLFGEARPATDKLRAGVSSMGFGGINGHVTLESADAPHPRLAPSLDMRALMASAQESELFVLSAATVAELKRTLEAFARRAEGISICEVTDLAARTAAEVDASLPIRGAFIAHNPEALSEVIGHLEKALEVPPQPGEITVVRDKQAWLSNAVDKSRVAFLFPAQGSQLLASARVLVERFDWARKLLKLADDKLAAEGLTDFSARIFRPLDRAANETQLREWQKALAETQVAQPAICLSSLLWSRFLSELGVKPAAVGGHSLGELTALQAAGAFDAGTLLALAALRGRAMAASSEAGTMASLGCGKEAAEAILEKVSGYVTVANINSPKQVAISGEKPAVEEAVRIALESGVQARILLVSHAMHSRLVREAADILRRDANVPSTFESGAVEFYSSVDGKRVARSPDLKKLLAEQMLAQVDFVALVRSMSDRADIFIEVGPGRVLTGLVTDIGGANAFPVESKLGADGDLNIALAQLYLRGVKLDLTKLYAQRLVRPFVAAGERAFIENPCERPFQVADAQIEPLRSVPVAGLGPIDGVEQADLDNYMSRRGRFLIDVIRADIQNLAGTDGFTVKTLPSMPKAMAPAAEAIKQSAPAQANQSVEALLIGLAAKKTGFAGSRISADAKLLDDLNLDSIKAGELVASAANVLGIAGKLDPAQLANATLKQVAEALEQHLGGSRPLEAGTHEPAASSTAEAEELLVRLISQRTGFAAASISADARLLDDLNLDSIKAGEVIASAAKQLGAAGKLDPAALANVTVRQAAAALVANAPAPQNGSGGMPPANGSTGFKGHHAAAVVAAPQNSWVRTFVMAKHEQKLGAFNLESWRNARVLVVSEATEKELAVALKRALAEHGAVVHVIEAFDGPLFDAAVGERYSHRIAILPRRHKRGPAKEEVRTALRRLSGIVLAPASRSAAIAYVEFAGVNEGIDHPLGSASSFGKSLHLERPDQRVRVVELPPEVTANVAAKTISEELAGQGSFAAACYDLTGARSVVARRVHHLREMKPRKITWTKDDVILVTGGARGITAECAVALAEKTGARFALAGRAEEGHQEVVATLQRFAAAGVPCSYFVCDTSKREQVFALVERVRCAMGPITGVVHGAGLNVPRRIEQVDLNAAEAEVAPKLYGAIYLCEALEATPPKLFVGLSSLIAIVGAPGNAWYGYSNQAMSRVLRAYGSAHPETAVQIGSFGIWESVGMGARFGAQIQKLGVGLIPLAEGARRFVGMCVNDPGTKDVTVTARLVGSEAWRWNYEPRPLPSAARFLENIVSLHPGVECITRPHLTVAKDPYLADHCYNGSHLLPTVFGLEAMAQAAAAAAGLADLGATRVVDIDLNRPIVVDPEAGLTIEITATALEREDDGPAQVRVTIGTEMTGFTTPHFSAMYELVAPAAVAAMDVSRPKHSLGLRPKEDLYSWLLFQGPLFQRIQKVDSLDEKLVLYRADSRVPTSEERVGKDVPTTTGPWILGDPFLRDAMLQSAQLAVTPAITLPVHIDALEVFGAQHPVSVDTGARQEAAHDGLRHVVGCNDGTRFCRTELLDKTDKEFTGVCFAAEPNGRVVERILGLRGRIIDTRKDYPTATSLAREIDADDVLVRELERVNLALGRSGGLPPAVAAAYLPGLRAMTKAARRERELHLLEVVTSRLEGARDPGSASVSWLESGQPIIVGDPGSGVSLSHDEDFCVAVAGAGKQGCDLAHVTTRSDADWTALLGDARVRVLSELVARGETRDRAGTRIWAAIEAAQKATGSASVELSLRRREEDAFVFAAKGANDVATVVTFPVVLDRREFVFAVAMQTDTVRHEPVSASARIANAPTARATVDANDPSKFGMTIEESEGRRQCVHRFPVSFKHCANLSRKVHFSNYFDWLGALREWSLWGVRDRLESLVSAGDAGLVTNSAQMQFLGEAGPSDVIEARLWPERVLGSMRSTLDLRCEFYKLPQNGGKVRLATSRMRTTWVRVLGHGEVAPAPFPSFLQDLVDTIDMSRTDEEIAAEPPCAVGEERFHVPVGARAELARETIQTGLEESNLIGNLYYANYFKWQGKVRDRFFYGLAPALYRGFGPQGEAYVLNSRVEFLRDAMPFDRIVAVMSLRAVYERGMALKFEYFAVDGSGAMRKLAIGEHDIAWVNKGVAVPLPAAFTNALLALAGGTDGRPYDMWDKSTGRQAPARTGPQSNGGWLPIHATHNAIKE